MAIKSRGFKKTIWKYTTSRGEIAPSANIRKPLGKHGFAATQKCIKNGAKTGTIWDPDLLSRLLVRLLVRPLN